jgi:glucose-fructose oxidoreductase
LHCDFAVRAAEAGVHVLCEKPLAVTEKECERMIDACKRNNVKLMTAYRLHFEASNLEAVRIVQSGKIGVPRYFNSIFSMQVTSGNIRLKKQLGGGPLYDLGVYCINASRYLFQDEPIEVEAITARGKDKRFREVEELAAALLRFPQDRLASFICSFGAADTADYEVVGTKGVLRMKNAYEYASKVEMSITVDDKTQHREFAKRDQFGPELVYFSDCILKKKEPEPSGIEGLNDVRVVRAIHESAKTGERIKLNNTKKKQRPSPRQQIKRPPIEKPDTFRARSASQ